MSCGYRDDRSVWHGIGCASQRTVVWMHGAFEREMSTPLHASLPFIRATGNGDFRGMMRALATLQGNQEPLLVTEKVGRPQVSFGRVSLRNAIFSLQ